MPSHSHWFPTQTNYFQPIFWGSWLPICIDTRKTPFVILVLVTFNHLSRVYQLPKPWETTQVAETPNGVALLMEQRVFVLLVGVLTLRSISRELTSKEIEKNYYCIAYVRRMVSQLFTIDVWFDSGKSCMFSRLILRLAVSLHEGLLLWPLPAQMSACQSGFTVQLFFFTTILEELWSSISGWEYILRAWEGSGNLSYLYH